ncbi:Guanine nucleotide-binding protein alpha subunit [Paramyrothecium foliicola]|nr:Guanine nucleotide-binding protein alpha subunit [Paramyrothecium foliicola]
MTDPPPTQIPTLVPILSRRKFISRRAPSLSTLCLSSFVRASFIFRLPPSVPPSPAPSSIGILIASRRPGKSMLLLTPSPAALDDHFLCRYDLRPGFFLFACAATSRVTSVRPSSNWVSRHIRLDTVKMGCGMSTEEKEGKARNEEIENQLKRDKMMQRNEIKMLLLGAGESGKSTILKQMKLIHEGGYSRDERESFKEIIFSNTVQSMRVILEAMDSLELPLEDQRMEYHVQTIFMQPAQIEGDVLPPEVGSAIEALWKDRGVQECFKRSREYQLNDSARYYFDNIARIAAPDYMPNDQDVLRSRVKTTGITETTFIIGDLTYRMFDVGGQRSERKKWIHCFENVTTILFLVAISEYDQLLFEDETVNRMQEALTLFDSICNSRWFIKTSIILFLNKIDRFKEKLPVSPMKNYFPDYEGGDDYAAACDYILNRFVSLNQHETKQIYTHFTCATDTTQIRFVMAAVNGKALPVHASFQMSDC